MQAAIEGIITELRQIGVPVSLAERIDAVHSLEYLPLEERATVKSALRAALIKNHDHELAFDALFELYFTPPEPTAAGLAEQDQDSEEDNGSGGAPGAPSQGRARGPAPAAADREPSGPWMTRP